MWYFVLQTAVETFCGYAFDFAQLFHTQALVIVLWLQDAVSQSKCWLLWLCLVMLCRGCFHSCCTVLLLYFHCTCCYCPAYQHYRVLQIESLQADNDFAKEQLAAMKGTSFFRPPFILWFQSFMNFLVSLFFFFTNISAALFLATLVMKVLKAAHSFQKVWKSGEEKKKSRKLK